MQHKASKRSLLKSSLFLLPLALLCACGQTAYTFPMISRETLETVEMCSGEQISGPAAVYTAAGDVLRVQDTYTISEELYGVVLDPPAESVMDVYSLAESALSADDPVLVLYLDGFGWERYQAALDAGLIPNLGSLSAQAALALYPTITPVNYAGMVTGQPPNVNGVTARGMHALQCETIFDRAAALGKTCFIAEGDTQILSFSVEQTLHSDLDGDGDTDSEVFAAALETAKQENVDLLFVHFHGIDDVSHAHGPTSQATQEKIAQTDEWVGQLMAVWSGQVIVIADHGQHENDGSGDQMYAGKRGEHGAFRPNDLLVPLLTGRA